MRPDISESEKPITKVLLRGGELCSPARLDLQTQRYRGLSSPGLRSMWFFFFRRTMEFHTFLRLILTGRDARSSDYRFRTLRTNTRGARTFVWLAMICAKRRDTRCTRVRVSDKCVGQPTSFPSIKHALSSRHRRTTNRATTPSGRTEPSVNLNEFAPMLEHTRVRLFPSVRDTCPTRALDRPGNSRQSADSHTLCTEIKTPFRST